MTTKGPAREVGIRVFKSRATQLLSEVRERHVEYVVTRRGEPIAVVRPYRDEDARARRLEGASDVLARLRRTARAVAAAAPRTGAARAVAGQRR